MTPCPQAIVCQKRKAPEAATVQSDQPPTLAVAVIRNSAGEGAAGALGTLACGHFARLTRRSRCRTEAGCTHAGAGCVALLASITASLKGHHWAADDDEEDPETGNLILTQFEKVCRLSY